ncbi:MAG: hypothetical protein M5U34_05275 [Chloroflexi bacterium]|nr:hypothetical protein [Chloroflexota bacterium]
MGCCAKPPAKAATWPSAAAIGVGLRLNWNRQAASGMCCAW